MRNFTRFNHLVLAVAALMSISSCSTDTQSQDNVPVHETEQTTHADGLFYETITEGNGAAAQEGNVVLINESMRYSDGTLLFSTSQIGHPVKFLIGGDQVIDGVDQGVRGMKIGEIRKLIVPPHLSKRTAYPDKISPDSTLYYEIELVEIVE